MALVHPVCGAQRAGERASGASLFHPVCGPCSHCVLGSHLYPIPRNSLQTARSEPVVSSPLPPSYSHTPQATVCRIVNTITVYVVNVHCHVHSDWTADVVDESSLQFVHSGGEIGRGEMTAWISDELRNSDISLRPGRVLECENVVVVLRKGTGHGGADRMLLINPACVMNSWHDDCKPLSREEKEELKLLRADGGTAASSPPRGNATTAVVNLETEEEEEVEEEEEELTEDVPMVVPMVVPGPPTPPTLPTPPKLSPAILPETLPEILPQTLAPSQGTCFDSFVVGLGQQDMSDDSGDDIFAD